MNASLDKMLLRFLDNAFIKDFLETQLGLTPLFNLTYAAGDLEIKELAYTRLKSRQFQMPVFETVRTSGVEERLGGSAERVKVNQEQRAARVGRNHA